MFNKLLVANRGEIAVRIISAARELGVRTVAVYSDADAGQMHAALADEAVALGSSEPQASYLDARKLIAAAQQTGAEAIHPGYGFLSESSEFAQCCLEAGITFVGPSSDAMRMLGAKIEAKQLATQNGVPVAPGYFERGASNEKLKKEALALGFPLMLKASAGGGGRGMRLVRNSSEFDEALSIASAEAESAFGSGEMMIEKFIERPRHIEVQVLADHHGTIACLFERECSVQRRHQKLIEESPSPIMSDGIWSRMQRAARTLMEASGYTNAGTVEFMFDEDSGEFYFLEVNTRLQVEHPVTEAVTGLDLVQWQLRISSRERLSISPELLNGDRRAIQGHAIEARIVAEDPGADFRPNAGDLVYWAEPRMGGVRVDTGYCAATTVPRFYDSLLAKVISHGESREGAIRRLSSGLSDFHILGVSTNIAYLLDVLSHKDFVQGHYDTGFLGREFGAWEPNLAVPEELADILQSADTSPIGSRTVAESAWDAADGFRLLR